MITFISAILILIFGYIIYGKLIEKFFGVNDNNETPAIKYADNVDYIPFPIWKIFTIQFLNIAGLGPIFGAVLGALYGPVSYMWIVLGCIFMGAVHDYFSGMLSLRNGGASLPELVGKYLGKGVQNFLRAFTIILLIFVGVAFVTGPAGLLGNIFEGSKTYWIIGIFIYYLIATLLPINKLIGKIYPFFGAALLIMAIMIAGYMMINVFTGSFIIQEIRLSDFKNLHANTENNILFPMMFIVISCGAISGFHSTQAPMMARCLKKESHGRMAFYGPMIAEGIVAIIWATAAMNYFGDTFQLNNTMAIEGHNPAWVVNEICNTWFGKAGAIIAIIGVVVLPITTGDTAFRSARLTIADILSIHQSKIKKRLLISIPLFVVGIILSQLDFQTIWKYLGLSNQVLATIVLWTGAMYLVTKNKNHFLLSIPAAFMTTVCTTYIFVAPIKNGGFFIDTQTGYLIGISVGVLSLITFFITSRYKKRDDKSSLS